MANFYTYKNARIQINNTELFANSLNLSVAAQTNPQYVLGNKSANTYTPTNGVLGSLKLNYYLTGADILKTFITSDYEPITGYFMGFSFNSGYLTNYSFSCTPNSPVLIDSEIVFFEDLKGSLNRLPRPNYDILPLNASNLLITNLPNYSAFTFNDIISLNFNYTNNIRPVYQIESEANKTTITPTHIVTVGQEINTDIIFSNLAIEPTFYGQNAGCRLTFTSPHNTNTEHYLISGSFHHKNITVTTNDTVKNTVSIKQNNVYEAPILNGFQELASSPTYAMVISGKNLQHISEVWFGDRQATKFNILNKRSIIAYVPNDIVSGSILLKGFGGEVYAATGYSPVYPAIAVTGISPISGIVGQSIVIKGNNFYRISDVEFSGGVTGKFSVKNSETIIAQVPVSGLYSSIKVISSGRNLTGISTEKFIPIPILNNIYPISGLQNDKITLSGFGFNWITGVYFNNILTTGFTTDTNTQITTYVPTGNIRGLLKLYSYSGVTTTANAQFLPLVKIIGIDPSSGKGGDFVRMTGYNIFDHFLHSGITATGIMASFGGGITGFLIESGLTYPVSTLTGLIPESAKSGIVRLFQPDGLSVYSSTVDFKRGLSAPVIYSINPQFGIFGNNLNISIAGTNVFQINTVSLTGSQAGINNDSSQSITGNYLLEDALGIRLNVINYPLSSGINFKTGFYVISISGAAGVNTYSPQLLYLS